MPRLAQGCEECPHVSRPVTMIPLYICNHPGCHDDGIVLPGGMPDSCPLPEVVATAQNPWVPCGQALPTPVVEVLLYRCIGYAEAPYVTSGWFFGGHWETDAGHRERLYFDYWMLLPPVPRARYAHEQ